MAEISNDDAIEYVTVLPHNVDIGAVEGPDNVVLLRIKGENKSITLAFDVPLALSVVERLTIGVRQLVLSGGS